LSNFTSTERPWAAHLLDSFLFYGTKETEALLIGAFRGLAETVIDHRAAWKEASDAWQSFLRTALVTYPTGETPSVTDSGYIFARAVRQRVGYPEAAILSPGEVVRRLARGARAPVIFVDDFLGTGSQFTKTWNRRYPIGAGSTASFSSLHATSAIDAFYVPLFATEMGVQRLSKEASQVHVKPAHVLGAAYSAIGAGGGVWPTAAAAAAGVQMIRGASQRAGIPDTGGHAPDDWAGFGRLGLTMAFEHSTPDASLAFLYWSRNDWKPLVQRT
jgi:hypothetical protein